MPYHADFVNWGVETFLASYCVEVRSGMNNMTHHSHQTVQSLLANAGFTYGAAARRSEVSLTAPLVRAYFTQFSPRQYDNMLPFSTDVVHVTLDSDDHSNTNVPVYVIPYDGGTGRGVKLPSQATDGLLDVYAVTATQTGCTVEISGTAQSPYASHTNVRDQADAAKQAKMTQRVNRLVQRFEDAERVALGIGPGLALPAANDPTQQRVQMRHFAPAAPAPAQNVNYTGDVTAIINQLDAQTRQVHQQLKGARVSTGRFSHVRYLYKPSGASVQDLNTPAQTVALVVGHRSGGVWSFYYQEWANVGFKVREVTKRGSSWVVSDQWILNAAGTARRVHHCDVVINYGRLWPLPTTQNTTW
jgi:hypothetical protein